MAKSVAFFGSSDSEFVELRAEKDAGHFLVRYEKDGKEQWRESIRVNVAELGRLAQWLDDFWNECPPAELAGGRLRFVYSHREHIGEGYYRIEFNGRLVLTAYEQLGTSNTLRAQQLRELAG
ncbi:MAG: hypothetical protein OHK0011_20470 [Turneriella sp.]